MQSPMNKRRPKELQLLHNYLVDISSYLLSKPVNNGELISLIKKYIESIKISIKLYESNSECFVYFADNFHQVIKAIRDSYSEDNLLCAATEKLLRSLPAADSEEIESLDYFIAIQQATLVDNVPASQPIPTRNIDLILHEISNLLDEVKSNFMFKVAIFRKRTDNETKNQIMVKLIHSLLDLSYRISREQSTMLDQLIFNHNILDSLLLSLETIDQSSSTNKNCITAIKYLLQLNGKKSPSLLTDYHSIQLNMKACTNEMTESEHNIYNALKIIQDYSGILYEISHSHIDFKVYVKALIENIKLYNSAIDKIPSEIKAEVLELAHQKFSSINIDIIRALQGSEYCIDTYQLLCNINDYIKRPFTNNSDRTIPAKHKHTKYLAEVYSTAEHGTSSLLNEKIENILLFANLLLESKKPPTGKISTSKL